MAAMTRPAPPYPTHADHPVCVLAGWPAAASATLGAEQSADGVRALLQLARGMTDAGRRVDLGGLEALVGRLCARSLDLMPEEGRRMALLLAGLLAELDALHRVMARHGDLGAPP